MSEIDPAAARKKAAKAADYQKHKAKRRATAKAWAQRNRDKMRGYGRKWSDANKDAISEKGKLAYWRDPERSRARFREWSARNPVAKKNAHWKCLYGVSRDWWDARLLAQSGLCAVCWLALDERVHSLRACVDHCHATGDARGILHVKCNLHLGSHEIGRRYAADRSAQFNAYLRADV